MVRLRGRAFCGQRVYDAAPHGHWCSTTMLSSIRSDGTTACLVVEGATDRDVFETYIQQVLVPTLRPGDCVIMDNLAPHKTATVERLLAAAGATWRWLPPYSPDLNPIEKMWSKVKTALRTAKARTPQTLLDAIGMALRSITPQDAAHWFASCGYTIT
jgi:transposase